MSELEDRMVEITAMDQNFKKEEMRTVFKRSLGQH